MWKNINGSSYYLLFTNENGYQICVTDYVSVWSTSFSETVFLAVLKKSNDILTLTNDNEYIQNGIKMLSKPEQMKKHKIVKEDDGKTLFVSITVMFGYPFTFECRLSKGSNEFYFHKITRTLLKTINDLRSSQTVLRHLLMKKDKEIDEYKEEGGEIVLRHLKTVAYDDKKHMKRYTLYEENFGETDLPTSLLDTHVELPMENVVKQELYVTETPIAALNIKQESSTQDTASATPSISAPMSCKQEVIKTEPKCIMNSPRKRMKKLNY